MARYPELNGKIVLVTGAGRGIGLAIATRFVDEGALVLLTDLAEGESNRITARPWQSGGRAFFERLDVTSRQEVEAMIAATVKRFGRFDVLVCNAGIVDVAPLVEATEESYDRQMAVNAKGSFLCATAAARQMRKQGGGRIIINASSVGKMAPGKGLGVYAMSKHAVVGLTRALGAELASDNVLVNCVCAGVVETPMWDLIDREVTKRTGHPIGSFKSKVVRTIPIGRIQRPEDVANTVVYLASDEASYSAGQTFDCTGGLSPC